MHAHVAQRIEPGPGRQHRDAAQAVTGQLNPGQARPSIVEHAHDIAGLDPQFGGIVLMQDQRLSPLDLAGLADPDMIHLAVQARCRLGGQQMERIPGGKRGAQILGRPEPGGMTGAIIVLEAFDRGRRQLDPPRRGVERLAVRIGQEVGIRDEIRLGQRDLDMALGPEPVEVGHDDAHVVALAAPPSIHVTQPGGGVALFRVAVPDTQGIGDVGQNGEVIARLSLGRHHLLHCHHVAVSRAGGDVVTLQGRGRRQDDVGVAGGRGPPGLIHDDRFNTRPGAPESVQVLVVMERVAARPVDQADIRVSEAPAIVVVFLVRLFQQVGHPRHRDEVVGAVRQGRQSDRGHSGAWRAHATAAAVAEAKAEPGLADGTEHGGEGDGHPVGLFAAFGALQRPAGGHEGGLFARLPRQTQDGFGGHAGFRRRPGGGFRHAVGLAQHIGAQTVVADGAAVEEIPVDQIFRDQDMRHGQHHGGVGAGDDGHPLGRHIVRHVFADRRDVHDPHARRSGLAQQRAHAVLPAATVDDLAVAQRNAAEAEHQARVTGDGAPVDDRADQAIGIADNARQQGLGTGIGVAADAAGEPAGCR